MERRERVDDCSSTLERNVIPLQHQWNGTIMTLPDWPFLPIVISFPDLFYLTWITKTHLFFFLSFPHFANFRKQFQSLWKIWYGNQKSIICSLQWISNQLFILYNVTFPFNLNSLYRFFYKSNQCINRRFIFLSLITNLSFSRFNY